MLKVKALGANGKEQSHSVQVHGLATTFKWPLTFEAQSVILDSHYLILRWTLEYRLLATALASFPRVQVNAETNPVEKVEKERIDRIAHAPSLT